MPSKILSYTVTGAHLLGNVSISCNMAEYTVSESISGTYTPTITLVPTDGSISSLIYVKSTASVTGDFASDLDNSTSGGIIRKVTLLGSASSTPEMGIVPTSMDFGEINTSMSSTSAYTLTGRYLLSDVTISCMISQYFVGESATGDWSHQMSLTPDGGEINTTIYVNFRNPSATGIYISTIVNSSSAVEDAVLSVSGSVSADAILREISITSGLTAFVTDESTASDPQSYTISGTNLIDGISITAPDGFELCTTSGGDYSITVLLDSDYNDNLYVRLSATAEGIYGGNIVHSSSGASDSNVNVYGLVGDVSEISVEASLSSFSTSANTPSAYQVYGLSGSGLIESISITAPNGFIISTDNNIQYQSITSVPYNFEGPIYVKLSSSSVSSYYGEIVHSSNRADNVSISVTGQVVSDDMYSLETMSAMIVSGYVPIATGEELNLLRFPSATATFGAGTVFENVYSTSGLSGNYLQVRDISLSGFHAGVGFPTIGVDTSSRWVGTYDGGGYIIDEFYNRQTIRLVGLFSYCVGATLKNINLSNIDVYVSSNVNYTSGLAGQLTGGCTADNCHILSGIVRTGGPYAGGFTSYATGSQITRCSASCTVSAAGSYAGGFIGFAATNLAISQCYADGYVEGFDRVGGFVGQSDISTVSISACYALGSVCAVSNYSGGFVGYINAGVFNSCYSVGPSYIDGELNTDAGFNGSVNTGTVTNCYWDKISSSSTTSDYGIGLTTAQMTLSASLTGFDFTNIWTMNPPLADGRPVFQWQ